MDLSSGREQKPSCVYWMQEASDGSWKVKIDQPKAIRKEKRDLFSRETIDGPVFFCRFVVS